MPDNIESTKFWKIRFLGQILVKLDIKGCNIKGYLILKDIQYSGVFNIKGYLISRGI